MLQKDYKPASVVFVTKQRENSSHKMHVWHFVRSVSPATKWRGGHLWAPVCASCRPRPVNMWHYGTTTSGDQVGLPHQKRILLGQPLSTPSCTESSEFPFSHCCHPWRHWFSPAVLSYFTYINIYRLTKRHLISILI